MPRQTLARRTEVELGAPVRCSATLDRIGNVQPRHRPRLCRNPATDDSDRCWLHQGGDLFTVRPA